MKLALLGGEPLNTLPFPRYPIFDKAEIDAVVEVVKKGQLCSLFGDKVEEFERRFAEYHQVKAAIAFSSGTAALQAAVAAAEIGPGDEVIVPAFTFWATATCVLMRNAIPVFADVDPQTMTLDVRKMRNKITARTKAIIPVHLNGYPAHMDEIVQAAREHGVVVIEDCAQAHGARYRKRLVGTIGDMGAFSFNQKKNLPTGEGGMLITDNEELATNARRFRQHGESEASHLAVSLGGMHRMTELEAAIGIEQLKKLDQNNEIRIENAELLSREIGGLLGIRTPYLADGVRPVYYNYAPAFIEQEAGFPRKRFIQAVQAEGVPLTRGVYAEPVYNHPLFRKHLVHKVDCPFCCRFYEVPDREKESLYKEELCPVTEERIYKTNLELKVHPPRNKEHMAIVARAFRKVIENSGPLRGYASVDVPETVADAREV